MGASAPLIDIAGNMGHTSIETTTLYTHTEFLGRAKKSKGVIPV